MFKIQKDLFYTVVPARSGSKSIKDKNILKINGVPLIGYVLSIAKLVKRSKLTILSSDSKNYLKIGAKYSPSILHLRSKKNSSDKATDKDFFREIIIFLKKKNYLIPEFFILLRPNTPNRILNELNDSVEIFFKRRKKFSSMRSMSKMPETSYKTFEIKKNILCTAFSKSLNIDQFNGPRQSYNATYSANGLVDILKTKNLLNGKTYGKKTMAYICKNNYIDIDYPQDLNYAKFVMKSKKYFKP